MEDSENPANHAVKYAKRVSERERTFAVKVGEFVDCLSVVGQVPPMRVRECPEFAEVVIEQSGKLVIRFVGDQAIRASAWMKVEYQNLTDGDRCVLVPVKKMLAILAKVKDDSIAEFTIEESGLRMRAGSVKVLVEFPAIKDYGFAVGQIEKLMAGPYCEVEVDPRSLGVIISGCRAVEMDSYKQYDTQCIGIRYLEGQNKLEIAVADSGKVLVACLHADEKAIVKTEKGVIQSSAVYATSAAVLQKMCSKMNQCSIAFSGGYFVIRGDNVSVEMPTVAANMVPYERIIAAAGSIEKVATINADVLRNALDVLIPMTKEDKVGFAIQTVSMTGEINLFLESRAAETDVLGEIHRDSCDVFDVVKVRRFLNVYKRDDLVLLKQSKAGSPMYMSAEGSPFLAVVAPLG